MKATPWHVLAILLVALSMVGGCTTYTDYGAGDDDYELAQDVLSRLQEDDMTRRHSFGVTAADGVVVLRGSIPNDMIRVRAIGVALGTPGVVEVIDELYRW